MENIESGDIVMVVKPTACCHASAVVGFVFEVGPVLRLGQIKCAHCGQLAHGVTVVELPPKANGGKIGHGIETWRLKRLRGKTEQFLAGTIGLEGLYGNIDHWTDPWAGGQVRISKGKPKK